jgi:NAD(P)-dependent dehydrogenase (short-subunit alcohol dehydrogenase family)
VTGRFDLAGKSALVTGATRGIGRAIALALAEHGARVAVSGRRAGDCDAVAREIAGRGGAAIGVPLDLERAETLAPAVERVDAAFGGIDVLVANAAAVTHVGPMRNVTGEAFDRMFAANVKSYVWLANLVLPGMAARRDGAIVLVGSISGLVGERSLGIYGLTKAAEMQLVRNIAVEYGKHGVRANAIAPGLVRTDMTKPLWSDAKTLERIVSGYPLRRIGEPEDIAAVAVFLASPAAAFMTGQTLVVDGGGLIGQGTPV